MEKPLTVESYFAGLTEGQRKVLGKLREQIRAVVPEAAEAIYYGMPSFRYHGKALIAYAAFQDHLSLFPLGRSALDALGEELKEFRTSKGTLQFTAAKPIPAPLLKLLVKARMAEIDAKQGKRPRKS